MWPAGRLLRNPGLDGVFRRQINSLPAGGAVVVVEIEVSP